jgi:elongation factor G
MREYTTDKLRNIALVGHQGSGKTTLVEAMLYNTGAISRMGRVEDGTTVSDWEDEERARKISISTSLIQLEFQDHKINVLDTPGYTDFIGDMRNAMRVADAVVVVVDAVSGVEVGTELAMEYAREFQHPIIVIVNKMDRENADFERTLADLRANFPKYNFVPVMIPIGKEAGFRGVAGALFQKAYMGKGEQREDLPADMVERVAEAHLALVEAAAEANDDYMQKYFDTGELSVDEVRDGMRQLARSHLQNTVPVFVASGAQNVGVYAFMEAFIHYVLPPNQRRARIFRKGKTEPDYLLPPQSNDAPLAAYVFKTTADKFVGTLSYFRIFSGFISSDSRNWNNTSGQEERFGTVMEMRGKEQINAPRLHVGDIGVVAKLQHTKTGDTIGDKDKDFVLASPQFPEPLYGVALTPRTQQDSAKMGTVLTSLCAADPTLRWRQDDDTKQMILEGMGELHIQIALKRAEALGVNLDTSVPKVPYRETITQTREATYRHKKQTGGAGQFGEVSLRLSPIESGDGFEFISQIVGGVVSQPFQQSTEKGVRSVLETGVLAGFPVNGVRVVLYDGKEHPVDSKDIAFQIAGREAFKEAFLAAAPALLEPIMDVKITVPEALMGDIMSDLNTRRGRVQGMDTQGNKGIVSAQVPLAEMLRYGNALRAIAGGRGLYTMSFSHYERVPHHLQDQIIAENKPSE